MSDQQLYTPVAGRFVSGSLTEKRTKDNENRPIEPDKQRIEFGVAFPKQEIWPFLTGDLYQNIAAQVATDPNAQQRLAGWFQTFTGFSMKITDGDKANSKGRVNEHTQGCFVFWFNSIDTPQTVGPDPAFTPVPAESVKRGYFVQVAFRTKANAQPGDRAGIYINTDAVRLIAEGEEIRGGVDAATAFGGSAAAAAPQGSMPIGSSSPAAGAFQPPQAGMPAPVAPQAGMPAPAPTVPGSVPAPVQTAPAPAPVAQMPPVGQPTASPTNTVPHTQILQGPGGAAPQPAMPQPGMPTPGVAQ